MLAWVDHYLSEPLLVAKSLSEVQLVMEPSHDVSPNHGLWLTQDLAATIVQ